MHRTLPAVVQAVAEEIARMGAMASALQDHLGDLVRPGDNAGMVTIQSIDTLTQGLEGLASFVHGLAASLPLECQPDLVGPLGKVRLASLAGRLAQDPAPSSDTELELFTEPAVCR